MKGSSLDGGRSVRVREGDVMIEQRMELYRQESGKVVVSRSRNRQGNGFCARASGSKTALSTPGV